MALKTPSLLLSFLFALVACSASDEGPTEDETLDTPDAFTRSCTADSECPGDVCITLRKNREEKPGQCSAACATDRDCPRGVCLPSTDRNVCFRTCSSDSDCPAVSFCLSSGVQGRKVCAVHTGIQGSTCADETECDEPKALCVYVDSVARCTGSFEIADALTRECDSSTASQCPGLTCRLLGENPEQKTGICTSPCRNEADCYRGHCIEFPVGRYCARPCQRDSDCDNGLSCREGANGNGFCGVHGD